MENDTKKCPYCAETIKAEAIVCRFCGRDLVELKPSSAPAVSTEPQKKKRSWIVWLLIVIGLLLCWLLSQGSGDTPSSFSSGTTYEVIYKVTGTASRASLTYNNEQGGTEQTEIAIPWEKQFTVKRGEFLYISAQNEGETGSVTCEIWVDGNKWRESTSSGAYKIASCSGSAGGN
jgi:hypothetical protein